MSKHGSGRVQTLDFSKKPFKNEKAITDKVEIAIHENPYTQQLC